MTIDKFDVIDAHIHLEQYDAECCARIVHEAEHYAIKGMVAVSMDLQSSKRTYLLHKRFGEIIIPAYGFHPEQQLPSQEEENQLVTWIRERYRQHDAFVIGEIGLPYYTAQEVKASGGMFEVEPYVLFLERMLLLAKELNKAVVLHAVYEDAELVLDLLQKHHITMAHFHWFKGSESSTARMIENGYYISITPDVFVEDEIRELVKGYPLEYMMVETDGPWPFEGPFKGKKTEPYMVIEVVKEIARIKELSIAEVASQIYQNSCKFYGI